MPSAAAVSRLTPTGKLRAFIEEMKASGFVAKALERHRIDGVAVAPPAAR